MSTENKNMPRLRFPGFTGEWVEKKLGEVLDYEQPTNYLVEDTNYKNNGIPVLTAGKTFILGYTDETHGIYNNLPVIIFDDFVTESKFVDFPFKTKSSAMKMLKLSDNNNNLRLIYELMQLLKYPVKEHKRYWISEYSKLTIPLPPTPSEQQKIAECLTAIDDLIVVQGKKVDALKEHKKGLMQQLFPQQGETTPRLRFPSFTGKWVEKKLGEVTIWDKFFQGVPRQLQPEIIRYPYVLANVFSEIERKDGDVLLLSTGNYVGWTTEDLAGDNLCEGEVVTIPWGGTANIKYAKGKFVTADNRIATSSDVTMLNNKFLYYTMLNSQHIIDGFYRGAGIKHPSMFDVLNMLISLPSLAEQQKIAECLSTLDDQIKAESAELDALKKHKKGLMQQLFPQPTK